MNKNIFDPSTKEEILSRLDHLHADSTRKWGSMNINQAIVHMTDPIRDVLKQRNPPAAIPRIFSPVIRWMLLGDKEWKPNSPTFKVYKQGDGGGGTAPIGLDQDKTTLISIVKELTSKSSDFSFGPHAGLGTMSRNQVGVFIWKHMDHHLRQFGV
jgi:hypothetical protein